MEHPNYDFQNMSLMEFSMLFEPHYPKKSEEVEEKVDLDAYNEIGGQNSRLITLIDNSKMRIRQIPAAVRVPYFKASTDEDNFYYSLLL